MKKLAHLTSGKSDYQIILAWRWLVVVAGPLVTLAFELVEGHPLSDLLLWLDLFIYGLFIPSITWLLLTVLAHNLARRAKSEEHLTRYRRFSQQLNQCREWDELTRFITEFPATLLPVEHTALFIYDHRNAHLDFVRNWYNARGTVPPINASLTYDRCQACLLAGPPSLRSTVKCPFTLDMVDGQPGEELCLPFSYNNMLVGILRLKFRPGQAPTPDQSEFMLAISPEIALALAISLSHPRQMEQVRTEAQMDERQYIAYVLHNSLAQQIGYLHLSLDRLTGNDRLQQIGGVREELEKLRAVCRRRLRADSQYARAPPRSAAIRPHPLADRAGPGRVRSGSSGL